MKIWQWSSSHALGSLLSMACASASAGVARTFSRDIRGASCSVSRIAAATLFFARGRCRSSKRCRCLWRGTSTHHQTGRAYERFRTSYCRAPLSRTDNLLPMLLATQGPSSQRGCACKCPVASGMVQTSRHGRSWVVSGHSGSKHQDGRLPRLLPAGRAEKGMWSSLVHELVVCHC